MDISSGGAPGGAAPQQGQPELSGRVLFYQNPEPLSIEKHRGLGVKQVANPFMFLRGAHAVPVTVSEFGVASTSYPVIFVGEDQTPVAVMGVRQGENEYVDAAGQPDPDSYIPAFARRYPFVFAADEGNDRLLLCVDRNAPMVSDTPDVPFFEGEDPSKFTNDAIEFCKEFERQRRATMDFMKIISDAGLLEQKSISYTPRDQTGAEGQPQKIADYWAVSEEKLNNLSDAEFLELRNNGALGAIYAHMVSLLNWPRVIQRALRRLGAEQAAAAGQPLS
ncbi:MAG: SapC family protein [Pseudomonadota bacterium]